MNPTLQAKLKYFAIELQLYMKLVVLIKQRIAAVRQVLAQRSA